MHVNCKQIFPWTISAVMICRKMQHRIVNLNMQNIQVFAKKKCSWSAKEKPWSKKMTEYKKMQYRLCILPFLEVTILFNLHVIIVGNTVGKSPTGILHSNPIYLVLKPLKLQNSWRIFDRPVSSMYCKYAEYARKLQTNLFMNNKQCHDMQKKCNIVL